MKRYIRTERTNLFEPNVYISMLVKIEGNISTEDVYRAVEAAYAVNETTMSKIVLDENGAAYYEKLEDSGCKICVDNREWREIVKESEKNTFAINEGELVRTYIINRKTENSPDSFHILSAEKKEIVLLIHAHHLAGDGKSILILINDILNSLAGNKLTFKPMVLIDDKFLSKRAKLLSGVKLLLKRANKKWARTGNVFTWDDYYAVHKRYWEAHSSDIEIKSFHVNELKKSCTYGVTLNSYLITKLQQEYSDSKEVGIPVDIREENNAMSNQTSGIALKYQYNGEKSFEENSIEIHNRIYKQLQDINVKYFVLLFLWELSPTLLDSVLLHTHGCYRNKLSGKMAKIMGYTGNGGRDLGVTNLTKIDVKGEYENFKISDILFVPPKVSYAKSVVGISTYGDKLSISYHRMKQAEVIQDFCK